MSIVSKIFDNFKTTVKVYNSKGEFIKCKLTRAQIRLIDNTKYNKSHSLTVQNKCECKRALRYSYNSILEGNAIYFMDYNSKGKPVMVYLHKFLNK